MRPFVDPARHTRRRRRGRTPHKAPKLKALRVNPKVALTIDDNTFPHKVLMVRGAATLEDVDGIVPEYELAARRYFGETQGKAWVEQVRSGEYRKYYQKQYGELAAPVS